MNKKHLLSSILAVATCLNLASCGSVKPTEVKKIAIGLYTLTGNHKDALDAYLKTLKDDQLLEITYFETGYDANSLLTGIAQQVAAGAQAIITTMDGGEDIADYCKENEVYYAGYLCDFESSFNDIKDNEYFLGTAVDGAYRGTAWGTHIAERVIAEGKKNIGMLKFPAYAYPHQAEMDAAFRAKIAEYNSTAAEADKITVAAETTEMPFFGFDTKAYLTANPDIDALYAMCGAVDSVYPNMTDADKARVAIYTAGYNVNITSEKDFGEGNCIQEMVFCNVESITYPLVKVINALDGKKFKDNPTEAQRIETSQVIIQTKAQLNLVRSKSIYHTANGEHALVSASDFDKLLARNGGTEAKLVKTVQSMTIDALN